MSNQRRGGVIQVQVDGVVQDAKGNFSYNLGQVKRSPVIGVDKVHGFKEEPQVAYIEGEITDRGSMNLAALVNTTGASLTLALANGKVIALRDAWYAGEGKGNTDEGNVDFRFESATPGQEVS
jgi:hypothetical protein